MGRKFYLMKITWWPEEHSTSSHMLWLSVSFNSHFFFKRLHAATKWLEHAPTKVFLVGLKHTVSHAYDFEFVNTSTPFHLHGELYTIHY